MADSALIFDILAIDGATRILSKVGGSWNKLALGVAAAGVTIVAKTTMMAANFQQQMTRLETSAGETQSNIGMVGSGILSMAGQVGDSATDLANAMYVIESGGQHGANGLKVLQAAAEGAKAENADLTTVADAVTSVLQDYHLKASDAALVTSQLVTAVGQGKTTFQDFAGALHSVLPIASANHVALSDVAGALASMTVHGMSADQASENLADTIKHLAAPTGVQVKELGQLGLSANDLSDMLGKKGVTGTLQSLSETILSHMGPSGKILLSAFNQSKDAANDANTMFNALPKSLQGLAAQFKSGALTLQDWRTDLKGLGPEQANQLAQWASMQNQASGFSNVLKSGGPAAQTYTDALRRVTGDATGLNTALMLTGENTAYTNAAVAKIAASTTEAGNHVQGWALIQKNFNQKMAEAKDTIQAVGIRIGNMLLPYMTSLIGVVGSVVAWFGQHNTIAKILALTILGLATGLLLYKGYILATTLATKAWTVTQAVLNAVMDANPISLIIIGVAALIAVVVVIATKTHWFQQIWDVAWGAIKKAAMAVWNWLKGNWPLLLAILTGPIGLAVLFITKHWDSVVSFVSKLPSRIAHATAGMWDGIKNAFRSAINWVISKWNNLHFSIPGVNTHIPGVGTIGGFTLGTPDIPLLAQGGIVKATPGGRLVKVAEGGQDEAVVPLSRTGLGGRQEIVLCIETQPGDKFAEVIADALRPYVRGSHGGNVSLALGGFNA